MPNDQNGVFIVRLTLGAFMLTASLLPTLSSADVKQVTVGARAEPQGPCEVQTYDQSVFFPGDTVAEKTQSPQGTDLDVIISQPLTD